MVGRPQPVQLVRGLGLLDATLLIVGSVIGSGIFFAPSIMAAYLQSPGLLLGLWVTGGLLTLAGALSYAELAAAMPRAGGQYVFLSEAFSPLFGFLYGWTLLLAINTGFVAAVAVAFAKALGYFVPGIGEEHALVSVLGRTFTTAQLAALVVIAVLTWLNATGLRAGATVQNLFTFAKLGALGVLVALAVVTARGSFAHFQPAGSLALGPAGLTVGLFAALAGAMSKALFSYDAWYTVTFAAEEVKDPERNLPRALVLGTLGVTVAYTATVAVYLYMVPIGEMAAVTENRIGTEAAVRMIGPAGGAFIAVAILVSTFGCVNGLILAGARVVYAMGRDGLFFRGAARVHPRYRTPAAALLLQGLVAGALTLTGTFSDLLTLTAFTSLLFNVLTVVGLFVLRRRRPDLPRPYRAWGYPAVPLLFVAVALFFLAYMPVADPRNTGLGLLLTATGVPAYLYWRRHR
ncbi:MAG TPA: amino acid permease [Vicinamibacteria bacterium]|nr:amino acid permease [Vicinamibacteria bacterium]